ncbi:restriction endonuclease FokI C-terminal domain-containing protein [uncultured Neglectibacter sp.]|uniref:restriction endonuclease FokI C-terminal domain-containing protein n=1 Tax=uncultured Neglectibacter sp. TaxID=1924108 RepID=UPI0034E015AA
MSRAFGWVQDGGSFENLKRVLASITPDSELNALLRERVIPTFVPERYGRQELITAITGENCNAVPYNSLRGSGSANQLTVTENIEMFGYSEEEAERIVRKGGRGNAACSGIGQAAVPAQKNMPNGEKKPYQSDWSTDSFIRWGISLSFLSYDSATDTCSVSELGRRFALSESYSEEEKEIIGQALESYPPACRVLKLLAEQGHLTKFEIGRRLGFVGEAGFTSLPQSYYVGGICTAATLAEKTDIRQNFEGSSDKYARMIAGWMCKIGWVEKVPKTVTEYYLGRRYTAEIGQSYMITTQGLTHVNRILGRTRHRRTPKIVFWNMLATAAPDSVYLRNRRCHILKSLTTPKTVDEIRLYLAAREIDASTATILDDLQNFTNIGLEIECRDARYKLKDEIVQLEIPVEAVHTERTELSVVKDEVRAQLTSIDHRYLALIDLAYDSNSNREFEIETMSLLTEELDFQGLHLGGSRKPDGLFYKHADGVIVDTKAYSNGYNLPITQADEMIRYIEENKSRSDINRNHWWENFSDEVQNFSFLFVSSEFRGSFLDNIRYIHDRTGYCGSVISAKNLLLFAERVSAGELAYEESFEVLRGNDEAGCESV